MAGLLDMFDNLLPQDEGKRSAALQGLLSAGLGMMANSYNQGGRLAPAIGLGGLQGMQAYGQGLESQQKQALGALQMKVGQQGLEKGGLELQKLKDDAEVMKRYRASRLGVSPAAPSVDTQSTSAPYGGGYSPAVSQAFGVQSTPPAQPSQSATQPSPRDSELARLQAAAQFFDDNGRPDMASQYREQAIKLMPKHKADNGFAINPATNKLEMWSTSDQSGKPEFQGVAPKPNMKPINLGGKIVFQNEDAIAPGTEFKLGQSPDSVASNSLGWYNAKKPQLVDGQWVSSPSKENPAGTSVSVPGFKGKAPEAYLKQVAGINNTISAAGDYANALEGWNTSKMVSPSDRAAMGTKYQNLLLQAKEAYNLGVLSGPDQEILQSIISNPSDFKTLATPTEAMLHQAKTLQYLMNKSQQGIAKTYNQTPNPDMEMPVQVTGNKKKSSMGGGWSATQLNK